ncbi:MAG TPA: glycosyltransferase family 2 protein [Candidatus Acidoferrales bacterium]|nr:glycosyltransferase family 2 protein [Candidatus Acidoferrales bacterium]
MNPRVGIVILNWNGGERTRTCVESALAQTHLNRFVIVVDNASSQREQEDLRTSYAGHPLVQLLSLDRNYGYAGGNNAGISLALRQHADMVLIATQDTRLYPDALARLVQTAVENPRVGVVGPLVVDTRSQRVLSCGERYSTPLLCVPRTLLRHRQTYHPCYPVGGILGCAMLLTRELIETVGCFDEGLFAYYEEVDLCLRARRQSFAVACNPQAVVVHDGLRGFGSGMTPLSAELKTRNLLRLMRRYARRRDWLLLAPSCALLLLGSSALYGLRGRVDIVAALLRGFSAGVSGNKGPVAVSV